LKKVIIIGGGIAGLSAAGELADCQVTLVEAKARFGGRAHSIRTSSAVVELGAEFVHGQSPALQEALQSAKLDAPLVSEQNQILANGRLEPFDVWKVFSQLTRRIDPREPDCSFQSFLDRQHLDDRTRQVMAAFAEGFNAAHCERLGAHALRRADYAAEQIDGAEQRRIAGGYSRLVDSLADKARAQGAILFDEVHVQQVRWRKGGVIVDALHNGLPRSYPGDAAIITLPLGVLKAGTVRFDPPLPNKSEAITGIQFGHVVKIILTFRHRWWGDDFGFLHALNEPIRTWWSNAAHPILVGWSGGAAAEALLNCSLEELKNQAVEILQRIFSISNSEIRSQLVSVHNHNWAADPHIRGAYSYLPVNGLILPRLLGAPCEETLFFAGEATAFDAQMGTVFGALESGQRAARELIASGKTKRPARTHASRSMKR